MNLEQYKIIHLPKEQWKNVSILMRYTTEQYYDVKIQKDNDCFHIDLIKEKLKDPISHKDESWSEMIEYGVNYAKVERRFLESIPLHI